MSNHAAAHDRDRIDERASYWVVLASERELEEEEKRELDEWRAADPRHERAWHDFGRTWSEIGEMDDLAGLVQSPSPELPSGAPPMQRRGRGGPKMVWGAVAAILLAIIVIPMVLWSQPSSQRYATHLAETRIITLPDGSQVTLAPASSLEVRFDGGKRHVALTGGEAFFEVVHDPNCPFTVDAGNSVVRVLGTKFDVNYTLQSVRVAVMQGEVEVVAGAEGRAQRSATRLIGGQRAEILLAPDNHQQAGKIVTAPARALPLTAPAPGAWREGRLVYDNVRLADLVSDVNRYYAPGVTIEDPEIGGLRVTAAFKVSEIPAFVSALDGVIAVKTQENGQGAFRLRGAQP